ncbi:efflux RND transporter periplasmic adaptor subunit [Roseibium litorale]|uniref:Efflux RND transporter periplasmic adaptor subunit n=1 Tax=Roseibium litorale TaxID=2803841 RepID=A0ABR9CIZ1_9HYPH|nr:efflux RND transporter periplasmic adaptor subunit [Roseibium litorale]MBD8890718.1 efflux RND transporter periplasmic adaptor subunit [Roseibium litorale]
MKFSDRAFSGSAKIFALLTLSALTACGDEAKTPAAAPVPSVTVSGIQTKDIRQSASFIGQVAAINEVELVARVSGFLDEKSVPDGSLVKKGQMLFVIEKSQYEANVQKAQADLDSAKADAALKAANEARDKDLFDKGHISQAAFQATQAQTAQAKAAVEAAGAALAQANLDLSYTDVAAPFDGRIGKTPYSVGDVVGPSSSALGTVIQLAPVYVNFSVSQSQYLSALNAHKLNPSDIKPEETPNLTLGLPNGDQYGETGKIVFIDNKVDTQTGTIAFRGEFANQDGVLVDGTYVSVTIESPQETSALMVPQAAVQRDQRGSFVLVVNSSSTVEQRYIQLGAQVGTDFIVKDGLQEGESVITEGLQKVRPGVPVKAIQSVSQAG